MDFITEFKKLAAELKKEDVIVYLEQARKMNDMDQELQEVIGNFNLTRFNLNTELMKEDKDEAKIAAYNTQLNSLYQEVMQNENMIEYNNAKKEADKLVQFVQAIMTTVVNGGDPMTVQMPEDNCSGSCSSCSGCH